MHSQKENGFIFVAYHQPDDQRNGQKSSNEEFTQTMMKIEETICEMSGKSPISSCVGILTYLTCCPRMTKDSISRYFLLSKITNL